jgi:hypothetical protein
MTKTPVIINFINFQLGWFACALGAAWGAPWVGVAVVLIIVAWHLSRMVAPRRELTLIVAAAVIGALWESLLVALGWIQYPNGMLIEGTAPVWMIALWMLFATTLNVSLGWLKRSLPLAILFGAIGGPLAYLGGAKLGALVFVHETTALVALAIGWGVLTPVLLLLARRYDGLLVANTGYGQELRHG